MMDDYHSCRVKSLVLAAVRVTTIPLFGICLFMS